jgi:protein-S-isoprenylcysteine O-methyltransferase Ste14
MQIDPDSPQVRFPPPLAFLGALVLGVAVETANLLPARVDGLGLDTGIGLPLGGTVAAAGLLLVGVTAGLFLRAGTNPPPWLPTTSLVFAGPYRWSRNPMYLGMAITYVGLAIALDSLVALFLLPFVLLWIQTQVIAREERYLERKFGDSYRSYQARVRRWL